MKTLQYSVSQSCLSLDRLDGRGLEAGELELHFALKLVQQFFQ